MLLSEFMSFIKDKSQEECNLGIEIRTYLGEPENWQNLLLSEDKWQALKWFNQFIDGDLEMTSSIRFAKDPSSLDGHIIEFQGKKYKLQEV